MRTAASYIILVLINYRLSLSRPWMFAHPFCSFSNPPADESVTLFYGEDFHITLPSLQLEVTFRNRSAPRLGEVTLMRGGVVLSSRARVNPYQSHLVIDAVTEGDEGIYTIKNPDQPEDVRHKELVVRGTGRIQNSFSFQISKFVKHSCSYNVSSQKLNKHLCLHPPAGDRPHVVCLLRSL